MTTRVKGIALVEVLVSVAILGLAMAPIVGIVHRSMSQIRAEKDEATAANVAGQVLNRILFEIPYDQVRANSFTGVMPDGSEDIDGTHVEWKTFVNPLANLKFLYRRVKYHTSHGSAREPLILPTTAGALYTDSANSPPTLYNNAANEIDKKYSGAPVMCDVKVEVKWRSPGETRFGRTETLFVRRAKLE